MTMENALRSEIRKVATTRMWMGLTIGGMILVGQYAAIIALIAGNTSGGQSSIHSLADPGSVRLVYGVPFEVGYLLPLVLGVTIISGEFRHQTITPTFLATPRRGRVLTAKAIVSGIAGTVMGVLFTLTAVVVGAAFIAARGYPVLLGSAGIPRLLVLMTLGLGIWAVFGLGFGALLKNQVAAILTALALVIVVESLLSLALRSAGLPEVAKLLPSNAASAIVKPSTAKSGDLLPWWGGALALLGWGVVTAILGAVLTLRRDIT
jgi:hypothetical protein